MELCVTYEIPHVIVSVGGSHRRFLGYRQCELDGRVFDILKGPKSDFTLQECAILNAQNNGTCCDFFMVLYDASRQPHCMAVSCSPHSDVNGRSCCCLMLHPSAVIGLHNVFEETTSAWALTSSEWPFFVSVVNTVFVNEFGLSGSEIVGQTLHRIKPHHTESTVWRKLLKMASEGRRAEDTAITRNSLGVEKLTLLTCHPVVDASNTKVEYVMVRFSPEPAAAGASKSPADPHPHAPHAPHAELTAAASGPADRRRGAPRVGRPTAPAPRVIDDAYVKRIQRRLRIAERRNAADPAAAADDAPTDAGGQHCELLPEGFLAAAPPPPPPPPPSQFP